MHNHLALHCLKVSQKIKQEMLRSLAIPNKNKKMAIEIATGVQPKISTKFQSTNMDAGQEILCHRALTRFFVCCGIPFWVIESPFFLDFCKNLCITYKPPNRKTLSNDWVNFEAARVTVSMENKLENQENLTLGK